MASESFLSVIFMKTLYVVEEAGNPEMEGLNPLPCDMNATDRFKSRHPINMGCSGIASAGT